MSGVTHRPSGRSTLASAQNERSCTLAVGLIVFCWAGHKVTLHRTDGECMVVKLNKAESLK
jgi:hypothetical protein